MKAQEMFKELGYHLICDDKSEMRYIKKTNKSTTHYYFRKQEKDIDIAKQAYGLINTNKIIPLTQLKAIIKQAEELGWLEQ